MHLLVMPYFAILNTIKTILYPDPNYRKTNLIAFLKKHYFKTFVPVIVFFENSSIITLWTVADRQTDRQTDRRTDKPTDKTRW